MLLNIQTKIILIVEIIWNALRDIYIYTCRWGFLLEKVENF